MSHHVNHGYRQGVSHLIVAMRLRRARGMIGRVDHDQMNVTGTDGAALLHERNNSIKIESRSIEIPAISYANPIGPGQLQSYFAAFMEKFVKNHRRSTCRPLRQILATIIHLKNIIFEKRWSRLDCSVVDLTTTIQIF